MREKTEYSRVEEGDDRNHNRSAIFDYTDGYIGITSQDDGKFKDRVLLTPKQFQALKRFVAAKGKR